MKLKIGGLTDCATGEPKMATWLRTSPGCARVATPGAPGFLMGEDGLTVILSVVGAMPTSAGGSGIANLRAAPGVQTSAPVRPNGVGSRRVPDL